MAHSLMPSVKVVRIGGVQIVKRRNEIAPRGFNQKLIVVGHQNVSMDDNAVSFVNPLKTPQKACKVLICYKDRPFSFPRAVM